MRQHVARSEGTLENPYKDTKGKLTVGTGFLVDDEKSFVAMPLEMLDPQTGEMRPATEAEKKAEFKRAKGLSNKQLQTTDKSPLSLPESENRRRLDAEITTRVDKVKTEIGETDWNKLTDGQKTALVDIHYANGSLEKFTKLKEAVKSGDAKAMAEQSDFHGGKMDGTDTYHRNFDRIRRNRAEMQGIDPESPEAYRAVADKYRSHPSLNDNYKKHASPGGAAHLAGHCRGQGDAEDGVLGRSAGRGPLGPVGGLPEPRAEEGHVARTRPGASSPHRTFPQLSGTCREPPRRSGRRGMT